MQRQHLNLATLHGILGKPPTTAPRWNTRPGDLKRTKTGHRRVGWRPVPSDDTPRFKACELRQRSISRSRVALARRLERGRTPPPPNWS